MAARRRNRRRRYFPFFFGAVPGRVPFLAAVVFFAFLGAAALAFTFNNGGCRPLDVQLAVGKLLFREDATLRGGFHHPVLQLPLRLGAALAAERARHEAELRARRVV